MSRSNWTGSVEPAVSSCSSTLAPCACQGDMPAPRTEQRPLQVLSQTAGKEATLPRVLMFIACMRVLACLRCIVTLQLPLLCRLSSAKLLWSFQRSRQRRWCKNPFTPRMCVQTCQVPVPGAGALRSASSQREGTDEAASMQASLLISVSWCVCVV